MLNKAGNYRSVSQSGLGKRWHYFVAALLIFVVEVLIATWLKDWHFIRAYFGDFLVVILLYWVGRAVLPRVGLASLAWAVFGFACLIEVAQYYHLADILQLQGVARIVLGTSFSWNDIAMYAAGCLVAYGVDKVLQRDGRLG